jgi:hypothetical protein
MEETQILSEFSTDQGVLDKKSGNNPNNLSFTNMKPFQKDESCDFIDAMIVKSSESDIRFLHQYEKQF